MDVRRTLKTKELFGKVQRGKIRATDLAAREIATVYPSSILHAPDDVPHRAAMREFVEDLERVVRQIPSFTG